MSQKKKKRQSRSNLGGSQSNRPASIIASFVKRDIHAEIRYITQLAQAEDSRIVSIGEMVLFSTQTRDAWLLDIEDRLAMCLCRDGEPQPFRIVDTPDSFGIEWTARFTIDGAAFIVEERSGRIATIHGYPVAEIAAACRGR